MVGHKFSCDLSRRREYDVVSIPDLGHKEDVVFVLTNNTLDHIAEDSDRLRDSVMATEYECLTSEGADIIAVVCDNFVTKEMTGSNIGGEIRKCCPPGQFLSPDLECSDNIDNAVTHLSSPGLPPRALLSPASLRPAPASPELRLAGPGCEVGEMVADLARGVTTGGLVMVGDTGLVEYQCVDTDIRGQLLALRCLDPGQCGGCVSKCCPPHHVYSDQRGCEEASREEHLWRHPAGGVPSYHHTFLDNFVHRKHFKRPGCDDVLVLDHTDDVYHLLGDGRLHHVDYGVTDKYCVDNVINDEGFLQEIVLKCFSGIMLYIKILCKIF